MFGVPSEAVNYYKRKKIRKIANIYLYKNKHFNTNIRFDVVEVYINKNKTIKFINLIKNAF